MPIVKNEVPVLSLSEYFKQPFLLRIPPWQREYTWRAEDEGEVGELLDDFAKFTEDQNSSEYLLGATILCEVPGNDDIRHVIDGQQRSVTLTIFFMCCLKYLKDNKKFPKDDLIFPGNLRKIFNSAEGPDDFEPRLRFSQPKADIIMNHISDWVKTNNQTVDSSILNELETYSQTQKNLISTAKYIYKQISEFKWVSEDQIVPAIMKIMNGVKLMQVTLNSQPEAIQVFDRINNRGMRLTDAELLKNLLFQQVSDDNFDTISENWNQMSQTLRTISNTKLQDPKYLLRAYAWTKWSTKTTYDGLVQKFENENVIANEDSALDFSNKILQLSLGLSNFAECKWTNEKRYSHLYPGVFLGSVQHFPVLLAGMKLRNPQVVARLCYLVGSRTALYVLSKQRPPEFETLVLHWSNAIDKLPEDATLDELNDTFEKHAKAPVDMVKQMQTNMRNWSYSNSADKKKIRASIAYMSWWLDELAKNADSPIESYFTTKKPKGRKGWDLDHVDALKSGSLVDMNLKNSIGNLVLLHPNDNIRYKAEPAIEKQDGYSQSKLLLTKTASSANLTPTMKDAVQKVYTQLGFEPNWHLDSWTKKDIQARTDFYVSFLTAILTDKLPIPKEH